MKGHDTIVRMFGLHFVKTGRFSTEYGELEEDDVMPLVEPAGRLIADVSKAAQTDLESLK